MQKPPCFRSSVRRELGLPGGRPGAGRRRPLRAMLWAAFSVLLGGFAGATAAQPPYQQKALPLFASFDTGALASAELADLDLDGDLDLLAGSQGGQLRYFVNNRSASNPSFVEATGVYSPFAAIAVAGESKPALADLDGDGDRDLLIGEVSGTLRYFRNGGGPAAPAFTAVTGAGDPFAGIDAGFYSSPALADCDGDGDLDLLVGSNEGTIRYYANTGGPAVPAFAERTGTANPFAAIDVGARSVPAPADLDGDGDRDLAVGEGSGETFYFENTGSSSAPAFVELMDAGNPLAGVTVDLRCAPKLADLDGDGDLDIVAGALSGTFFCFRNTGSAGTPHFVAQGSSSPFAGIDFGDAFCRPEAGDLDHDGDLDVVVADFDGHLRYFENTGTSSAPALLERTGAANPLAAFALGLYVSPDLVDFDGDGDLDVVAGEYDGNVNFLANTGSPTVPRFVLRTGAANPFAAIDVGRVSFPLLADLDHDGDLDAVIGNEDGYLRYFINNGTTAAPLFVELTGKANPFEQVDPVIGNSAPAIADFDGDGDLDVASGGLDGDFHYFQNSGDASFPAFVELIGSANPFRGIDVGYSSVPALADLDGDGDLDLLVGEVDGHVVYFASSWKAQFADGFESGDTSAWSVTLP